MLLLLLACTRGTKALNHIVYRVHDETVRQQNVGDWRVIEAECLVTVLATKVYVHVVIIVIVTPVAHAELVFHVAVAVFNGVNEMVFTKKGKASGYAALVNGEDSLFQFGH